MSGPNSFDTLITGPVGVAGLGLLGQGIAACLLAHGFRVVAFDSDSSRYRETRDHVRAAVDELVERAGFPSSLPEQWNERFFEAGSLADFKDCGFIIESAPEDFAVKQQLFSELEEQVGPEVPIATNTSAIPITLLQAGCRYPERLIGMHWGEPCHILRFLEVIRGEKTSESVCEVTLAFAGQLGKEPVLVRKDFRGFIVNRLMYAMMREALHLLESGVGDAETIDRAFQYDIGWWAAMAGPFRWMDLTGLPAYAAVMEDLFPELSNATDVPEAMRQLVESGANGVENGRGFYRYEGDEAERWKAHWQEFTWGMRELTDRQPPPPSAR